MKPTGSFVLNIKESVFNGQRHPYVFDLVKDLQRQGWRWNETYIWRKENSYPIKPIRRLKDQWEYLFHFTKGDDFKETGLTMNAIVNLRLKGYNVVKKDGT